MPMRHFIPLLALLTLAACAHKTQRTPSLAGAPPKPAAPERNYLKEAGDTTWQVVTAPARMVTPKKEEKKQPETYAPPAAVIVRRSYVDPDEVPPATPAASAPATTRP
ncbi:MAG TPA: hypothetical protein VHM90_14935 [Phycisphaerae bacterium]|nr:hypothetical protein [Phycisphaerae bacterium]